MYFYIVSLLVRIINLPPILNIFTIFLIVIYIYIYMTIKKAY